MMPSTETSSRLRTALFGGSFDPVHLGHLFLLHQAAIYTSFERIIISPAFMNNFKREAHPALPSDRLEMLRLSLEDYHELYPEDTISLVIDRAEIDRCGVSYSYDTVQDILSRYEIEGKLGFLIGDDLLPSLHRWYRANDLFPLVSFFCFTREGAEAVTSSLPVQLIPSPSFAASSTEVREGKNLENLLSKRVLAYVQSHQLYQT